MVAWHESQTGYFPNSIQFPSDLFRARSCWTFSMGGFPYELWCVKFSGRESHSPLRIKAGGVLRREA
eukprot:2589794-Amphidinium_carterae.1